MIEQIYIAKYEGTKTNFDRNITYSERPNDITNDDTNATINDNNYADEIKLGEETI